MQAPDWYDAWCEAAFAAFTAKQKALAETYRLDSWLRYDYDTRAGLLTFSDAQGPRVVADIQVVGATSDAGWVWGWANDEWSDLSVRDMRRVRDFGEAQGVEELTTRVLKSDDLDGAGWMLSAISARILEAAGAYRAPTRAGATYLLIKSIKFVS